MTPLATIGVFAVQLNNGPFLSMDLNLVYNFIINGPCLYICMLFWTRLQLKFASFTNMTMSRSEQVKEVCGLL
jgi:hypothetical protein